MKKVFNKFLIIIAVLAIIVGSILLWNKYLTEEYDTSIKVSNITNYVKYHKNNKDANINEVIAIVNKIEDATDIEYSNQIVVFLKANNYVSGNLTRYLSYQKDNLEAPINEIIQLVNANIDTLDIKYSPNITKLMSDKYFIKENLERYLKLYKDDIRSTIELVNAGADQDFYTNIKDTDILKKELMLVNKFNQLESDYIPEKLVTVASQYGDGIKLDSTAYAMFIKMAEKAEEQGLIIKIHSGYRSYIEQKNIYDNGVKYNGISHTDLVSARPGNSEHQTGLAMDLKDNTSVYTKFGTTASGKWVYENAHLYGFIQRYQDGKTNITGYNYESWHYRYVGVEVATYIYENNITFDEYYEYFILNKEA